MSTGDPLPLPSIRGPKLEPFRGTASAEIEFLEFVGSENDCDSKVWKVRIDGEIYALKINWEFLEVTVGTCIMPTEMDPLHRPDLTPQEYIDYMDPFNCECRAYGRLKQEKRENLAIHVHGYILLTREQEQAVTEALGHGYVDWEKHPDPLDCNGVFSRWEAHRHHPLRAIVKEYVESLEFWTASQVPQMYSDLEELHKLGILVRDIHPHNYLRGKLVDFSMAWTMYHPCLERSTSAGVHGQRLQESYKFEQMVDLWAYIENKDITKPEALVKWHSQKDEDLGIDPRLYNWQKWEQYEEENLEIT